MFLANKLNKGAGSPAAPVDAQFNYVTMLLHGDGTNGAQNNTFVDSGPNTFTITRNGNTTQGSFSPYGSNWSNFFDGNSTTYLSVPSDAVFQFGTGDFTIECWFYDTGTSDQYPAIISSANGWQTGSTALRFNNIGTRKFGFFHNPTGDPIFSSTNTFSSYQWYHVAVTRSGTSMKMFVNGVEEASATVSASISLDTTTGVYIGSGFDASSKIKGYISNVRVVKGTAVYTSAFTPSTTPLTAISGTSLLTCQTNRFKDNSAQNFTLTIVGTPSVQRFNPFGASTAYDTSVIGGSGYFDGSGDYLSGPTNNAAFQFGTGDFTVECWLYQTATTSYPSILEIDNHVAASAGMIFIASDGTNISAYNGAQGFLGIATAPPLRAWNHIAWVRSSGVFKIYVNGVGNAGFAFTQNLNTSATTTIGSDQFANPGYTYTGNISNLRVVKGTAVYTSNFTPPTAPLTAITNTSLLTSFTNGAIFDNAMMNDLETAGNAQISTSVVKYGTGSLAFDGTGDYLVSAPSPNNILGGGDFTIEFWLYPSNTSSGYRALVASENYNATTGGWSLYQNGTSIELWGSPGASSSDQIINATSAITTSTWQHLALSRASGTLRLFLNGISVASVSNSTSFTGQQIWISDNNSGSYFYDGYIDDLRITKGYARYTSTFTPPTAAFPNIGPV